jgi:uncharacterized protein YecT (DUF1311 family)
MNNPNFHKYILASILLFSNAAMANITVEICETTMATTPEVSRCLDGIKTKKDRELKTWINNQLFILEELAEVTGRKGTLTMFKRSQRNFIAYRENNCRWQYLAVSPGTGAAAAFKKCYIALTQDRINELTNLNKPSDR